MKKPNVVDTTIGSRDSPEQPFMPAASTALIASGVAAKKAIENIVTDLYTVAKKEGKSVYKRWKASQHIDSVYKKAKTIRMVKTILQPEKEVDLTTFYYPSKVEVEEKRTTINRLADFGYNGNILIEGTVGQGKSIFLRYLASVELFSGVRVPAFIELRRLRPNQTLLSMAMQELKALGFDVDDDLFPVFATNGKLVLCLDAFDEVKEELRQELLSEIELLSRQYGNLQFVVTSRPGHDISTSAFFRTFRLSPLRGREFEDVIIRLAHNEATALAIIQGIKKEAAQISLLLTTPLMVALLLIRYRIDQSIPQNDIAFYDALFAMLLTRHDKSKGGYVRPRKSKLNDTNLEHVFNALCYLTRKADETSFTRSQLLKRLSNAIQVAGLVADIDNVLADIIEITCLIVSDGGEYRFIHKSVQEYHAAVFIRDQPEQSAAAFYKAMESRWTFWQQELRFLSVIDRYRFLKLFHIPQLRQLLGVNGPVPDSYDLTPEKMNECCGGDFLAFHKSKGPVRFIPASTSRFWPTTFLIKDDPSYMFEASYIKNSDIASVPLQFDGDLGLVSFGTLLKVDAAHDKIKRACEVLFRALLLSLQESEEFVQQVEERKAVFEF